MINEEELSTLFENSLKMMDDKMYQLIMYDFNFLTDYYIKIINNEENTHFCIDPCPHLEIYVNKENLEEIYKYLTNNQMGYYLLVKKIKEKYKIVADPTILETLLDYYYDFLIKE